MTYKNHQICIREDIYRGHTAVIFALVGESEGEAVTTINGQTVRRSNRKFVAHLQPKSGHWWKKDALTAAKKFISESVAA